MREATRNQKKADYNPGLSPPQHPENKVNIANLLKTLRPRLPALKAPRPHTGSLRRL